MNKKHAQPAELSYFFLGGFVEIRNVVLGAFKHCGESLKKNRQGLKTSWANLNLIDTVASIISLEVFEMIKAMFKVGWSLIKLGFYVARLVFSAIVTPIICAVITLIQVLILLTMFLFSTIFFAVIILIDRIYCSVNSIANHCPFCQKHYYMPQYVCSCGNKHSRLRPGVYGILKRKCNCGALLPTTFLNGRQKLDAQCPFCGNNVKGGGLQASWCIPVVGGPSSGKTVYINMTMMSLEKNSMSMYGLPFVYEDNGLDEYKEISGRLLKGYLPDKTTDHRLRYYQFSLTPPGATKQLISLCDVAGELFDINSGGVQINAQIGFRFANSFIMVIDPLAIPSYREEVSGTTQLQGYKASAQSLDEMVDMFVRTLQNMFSIKANAMLKSDVAVVFTKVDIPGLEEKIGESAVLKKTKGSDMKERCQTRNKLCEQFLREYNEENFLLNLKSRFKSIQFFTCSALGHVQNGEQFTASNVEEPFYWLVKKKSKVISKVLK